MSDLKIQKIWQCSFDSFLSSGHPVSDIQKKVSHAVMRCKSGALGANACQCTECGHTEFHNNSCRNRNCPNCQAVLKEIWVDKRREEIIDAPYFHVVFTLPHELNPLIYCNQKLLYGLFHRCCAETLLELSYDKKYLGATPGIIQVLHTWNQEIGYLVHMHCIVSGGGLTYDKKIRRSKNKFFIPVGVLRDKFKGKYLSQLDSMYRKGQIVLSSSCEKLRQITLEHTEFIRRYLMHVLPSGFQKICYYGFLNNRMKRKNLKLIFTLQGHQRFKRRFTEMSMSELLKAVWDFDISICPDCGHSSMKQLGRCYAPS